ncbi:unnamed protein product [Brassica oleracea var. botrytis]
MIVKPSAKYEKAWSVKNCRGMVLGRGFLGPQICGPRGTGLYGIGSFTGWTKTGHARLDGPAFFFLHFLFYLEKTRKRVRRKQFL